MRRIVSQLVAKYCLDDRIGRLIAEDQCGDRQLTVQRWLAASPAKRLIAELLYSDLLASEGLRILDVGGGLSTLTRWLAARHDYELVELMVHDPPERVAAFCDSVDKLIVHASDWWSFPLRGPYDLVIANDLFPNADQRLALFLERVLPSAREVRLSLTYYNRPRFYQARRLDAEEILWMLAWDGRQTRTVLAPFANRIEAPDFAQFECLDGSVFENGRQVCVVSLRGDVVHD
jgi:hypothetical protein